MEQKWPKDTTVDFVETTNSLRPQYSVEIIDPEILKLWARQLGILGKVEAANRFKTRNKLLSKGAKKVQAPLNKFTLFPLLPAELRIKIWKFAIFPRIVMRYSKNTTRVISKPFFTPSYPVLMHTSAQAREVALERFTVVNAEHPKPVQLRQTLLSSLLNGKSRNTSGPTVFNFELDTLLCLDWDGRTLTRSDPCQLPGEICRQVRHMGVSGQSLIEACFGDNFRHGQDRMEEALYQHLKIFESLKTICIFGTAKPPPKQEPWRVDLYQISLESRHTAREYSGFVWHTIFRDIAATHQEWKPKLSFARVQFRAIFPKD